MVTITGEHSTTTMAEFVDVDNSNDLCPCTHSPAKLRVRRAGLCDLQLENNCLFITSPGTHPEYCT